MNKKGFTLVELAIVMVIIGLLVGGVLQGQELIKQAQVRKVLTNIRSLDTGVTTFVSKYEKLPGDFNKADAFALCDPICATTQSTASIQSGDGDGLLESASGTDGDDPFEASAYDGEIANFFVMLSAAGLVKGSYTQAVANRRIGTAFPEIISGSGIIAVSHENRLRYMMGVDNNFVASDITGPIGSHLSSETAFSIDSKLDDGKPNTGATIATVAYPGLTGAFPAPNTDCADDQAIATEYDLSMPDSTECFLTIRSSY